MKMTDLKRRDFVKGAGGAALGAGALSFLKVLPAEAAGADGTAVVVIGDTINSLDIHRSGTSRPSYQVAVNCYDRLVAFDTKTLADGSLSYDYEKVRPEIAESWTVAPDGMSMTFKIKPNAKFQDGTKVTAHDVKWSLDRAVSVGGFPTVQMKAGSLEKPEQFVVVDDMTFRIDLLRKSKLTLPDLAVPVPFIINSKLAKQHATEKDPWAREYLHRNVAGSGAYKVERWNPGQQLVYTRNDNWVGGKLPGVKRVIVREVPSLSTRRALIERGDIHMSYQIPAKDAKEIKASGKATVVGTPVENAINVLGVNFKFEPFKDPKVRQAVAFAVPYEEIFQTAAYGRGVRMWGGKSMTPETAAWPQPFPYTTDYDKAKDLLGQTAFKDGFKVPISINMGLADWQEPTALLLQESLAKIGIETNIEKIPGAGYRTAALVEKRLALHIDTFGGWLNYPCYYFFWSYMKGHLFNSSNYDNPEIDKLVNESLHMETSNPAYAAQVKKMFEIAWRDLPRIALWQPVLEVAHREDLEGYEYHFHRVLDARKFAIKA